MPRCLPIFADPMIAILLAATVLAALIPATGEARGIAQTVSSGAIFVLFLVNGMRIARGEIARGMVNWRFFLPLFAWVFGVMPMIGLGLSNLAASVLPPMVALGFLYCGTLPSTVQSATSYTSLAGGNIALSVVGAALLNIAGVFVTAPLFAALAGSDAAELGSDVILRITFILILPFVIGQTVQSWTLGWLRERKAEVAWLDRIVIAIAVYVAFSGAVEQGLGRRIGGGEWALLLGLVCVFLVVATVGAWIAGTVLRQSREERVSCGFAGAQKSVAIGAPLAAIMFPAGVAGFVIAPLLLYHLLQLIVAAPLAQKLAHG